MAAMPRASRVLLVFLVLLLIGTLVAWIIRLSGSLIQADTVHEFEQIIGPVRFGDDLPTTAFVLMHRDFLYRYVYSLDPVYGRVGQAQGHCPDPAPSVT